MGDSDTNNSSNTDTGNEIVLNNRQIEILSEQSLPTAYSELTSSQKNAIVSIEEMLRAVEEKYGISFSCAGYMPKGALECEQLIAYPSSGNELTDTFTVKKKRNGDTTVYEDDYMDIAVKKIYCSYVTNNISEMLGNDRIKMYSIVSKTTLTTTDIELNDIPGNVEAGSWIFIDGTAVGASAYLAFIDELKVWLKEQRLYGLNQIILLKPDNFNYVTEYNYTEYLTDTCYIYRNDCNIQRD